MRGGQAFPFGFGFIFPRQLRVGCGTKLAPSINPINANHVSQPTPTIGKLGLEGQGSLTGPVHSQAGHIARRGRRINYFSTSPGSVCSRFRFVQLLVRRERLRFQTVPQLCSRRGDRSTAAACFSPTNVLGVKVTQNYACKSYRKTANPLLAVPIRQTKELHGRTVFRPTVPRVVPT